MLQQNQGRPHLFILYKKLYNSRISLNIIKEIWLANSMLHTLNWPMKRVHFRRVYLDKNVKEIQFLFPFISTYKSKIIKTHKDYSNDSQDSQTSNIRKPKNTNVFQNCSQNNGDITQARPRSGNCQFTM
jgi:hypothetical protein